MTFRSEPPEIPEWRGRYDGTDRGLARPGWAAQQMGLSFDGLLQRARDEGISTSFGIDLADLVRLMPKLIVQERDPERKAHLRAAMKTFIAARDHDREQSAPVDS